MIMDWNVPLTCSKRARRPRGPHMEMCWQLSGHVYLIGLLTTGWFLQELTFIANNKPVVCFSWIYIPTSNSLQPDVEISWLVSGEHSAGEARFRRPVGAVLFVAVPSAPLKMFLSLSSPAHPSSTGGSISIQRRDLIAPSRARGETGGRHGRRQAALSNGERALSQHRPCVNRNAGMGHHHLPWGVNCWFGLKVERISAVERVALVSLGGFSSA